jgi:hypothetical protein
MRQSIEDGVTLEIVYEGRTHKAEVSDTAGADAAFQDVFSDYNLQERMEILGFGSRDACRMPLSRRMIAVPVTADAAASLLSFCRV